MIRFFKNWYSFGKEQGFWFSMKYNLGIAKEGKDFISISSDEQNSI